MLESKKGYKKTKLGWIPEDWELKRFTDFSELIHGFQFRKEHFVAKGIPVIKIGSLIDSKGIDFADASYIDPSTLNQFEKFKLFKGDVLMALTGGTLGKVSVVQEDFGDILQNYRVGKFVPKKNSYGKYLVQLLQSFFVQQRVKNLVNEAAQPNFGKQDFDKIWIPLPPLPEQQKIAAILSTWDKAIDKLTQLIAAKEQRKKGLMQQLLSGKKRFAGFKGDIKKRTIGKSINQITGFAFKSSEFNQDSQGIRLCRGVNISKGFLRFDQSNEMFWNGNMEEVSKYFLEENDIVISMDGSLVGRNYAQISNKDLPLLLVQRVAKIKSKSDLDQSYLFQCVSSAEFTKHVDSVKTSSGIPHISSKDINSFKIHLPSIEEQQKIACVLTAADKEIELLKNELGHLQQQKKGLMQVLLTGEVRVKIN